MLAWLTAKGAEAMVHNPDKAAITAESWDFYVGQTSGAESIFAAYRDGWLKAHLEGGDLRPIERSLAGHLQDVVWTWPWFDTWLARFQDMGVFPSNWVGIEDALAPPEPEEPWDEELLGPEPAFAPDPPFDPAPMLREEMLKLLLQCVWRSAYAEYNRQQHSEMLPAGGSKRAYSLPAGPNSTWSFALQNTMDPKALVEAVVAPILPYFKKVYPDQADCMPPYFPGDRTDVRAWRPAREEEPRLF